MPANTLIEYGGRRTPIATPHVTQAFFFTINHPPGPQGRGSRFPMVMNRFYAPGLRLPQMLALWRSSM